MEQVISETELGDLRIQESKELIAHQSLCVNLAVLQAIMHRNKWSVRLRLGEGEKPSKESNGWTLLNL